VSRRSRRTSRRTGARTEEGIAVETGDADCVRVSRVIRSLGLVLLGEIRIRMVKVSWARGGSKFPAAREMVFSEAVHVVGQDIN